MELYGIIPIVPPSYDCQTFRIFAVIRRPTGYPINNSLAYRPRGNGSDKSMHSKPDHKYAVYGGPNYPCYNGQEKYHQQLTPDLTEPIYTIFIKPTALANERSKSPVTMTRDKPNANIPPMDVVKRMLVIIEGLEKLSDTIEKNITIE